MLSDSVVRRINNQIEDDLRTISRYGTSEREKDAALNRIVKLKSLLDPNPTPQDVVSMLASALKEQPKPEPTSLDSILSAIRSL